MPTHTQANLEIQSDLRRASAPIAPEELVNKDYVDSAIASISTQDAGAGPDPAGGVKGIVTLNQDKGLDVGLPGVAEVKVDGVTVKFNGLGQLEAPGGGGGGALSGQVSEMIAETRDIAGVSPPILVTVGSGTDALRFPDGVVTGQRFLWRVPDDYFGGDAQILASFNAQAPIAAPNNQVQLELSAEIFPDGAAPITIPTTPITLTVPDNSTDFDRQVIFTLAAANLSPGAVVQVFLRRIGADPLDLAATGWQVIALEGLYVAALANRGFTEFLEDTKNTDEPAPALVTVGTGTDALSFPSGSDAEQRVTFVVPQQWDGVTPPLFVVNYLMGASAAGTVRLATEGEVFRTSLGSVDTLPVFAFDLVPPADIQPHKSLAIRQIEPSRITPGDVVTLKLARRTAVAGNHPADFRLIALAVVWSLKVTQNALDERYLELSTFEAVTPGVVSADTGVPDFGGDFEMYDVMSSTAANGRVRAIYFGRLRSDQTKIKQLLVPIKGSAGAQYSISVFVDGSGATNVYTGSAVLAAPVSLTEVLIQDVDLTNQPVGKKRYFVMVDAFLDAGETLSVGRPFATQE